MEYTINSTVFGNWIITEKIGEGSYGTVYKIQKTDYGITTHSALKVIRIPRSTSDIRAALNDGMDEQSVTTYFQGFVDEIVQEVAVMSSLKSHPNIVNYEDHTVLNHNGEIGWDILIRMELLTPLQDYLSSHRLSENDVIRMAENLCDALAFCQKKGLIHRDIKPENIFISETGQFKLGDFGVARTIEKTTGGLSKKGTESYMAPEIYLNKPYGSSVDIYSLGLVLYKFMNNNRLPFFPLYPQPITFADRENALSRRMKGDNPSAPVNACKEFADIILKACAYKPEERYRTAADMLEDIRRLRIHLATAAETETLLNKQADLIPPMASNTPSSQENDAAQTQGIFEEISNEETIGLWNMEVETGNDIIDNISDLNDIPPIDEEAQPPVHKAEADKPLEKMPQETRTKENSKHIITKFIPLIILFITAFTLIGFLSFKKEEQKKTQFMPYIQQISALISNDEFDNALDYCKANGKELKIYFKGWIQDGKLYSSKKYNETAPVIYFENNPDENSFYIYGGIYNSEGKRNGNGKELCIYYDSGSYYYSEGKWVDDILASGNATKCEITDNGYTNSLTGEIINNKFSDKTRFESKTPSGHISAIAHKTYKQINYFFED